MSNAQTLREQIETPALIEQLRARANMERVDDDTTDDEFVAMQQDCPQTLDEWRELIALLDLAADRLASLEEPKGEVAQQLSAIVVAIRARVAELKEECCGDDTWFGWSTQDASAVADGIELLLARLASLAPPQWQLEHEAKGLQWTLDNVYTIARRELRRLERLAYTDEERDGWRHVIRLCEKAGCQGRGVLRDNGGAVSNGD